MLTNAQRTNTIVPLTAIVQMQWVHTNALVTLDLLVMVEHAKVSHFMRLPKILSNGMIICKIY